MKNIVIADDDKAFLNGLAEVLRMGDASYDVFVAENGEQADTIMNTVPVDLLITDIRMPVMDGLELMRRVSRRNPDMPVIVISACSDAGIVSEFGRKNYHFFDKPLVIRDLINTVRTLLDHERRQ